MIYAIIFPCITLCSIAHTFPLSAIASQDKYTPIELQDKVITYYNEMQAEIGKIVNSKRPIKNQSLDKPERNKVFLDYLESKMLFTDDKFAGAFISISRVGFNFSNVSFQDYHNSYQRVSYYSFCAPTYYVKNFLNSKDENVRLALSALYHFETLFNSNDQAKIDSLKHSVFETLTVIKGRINAGDRAVYKDIDYANKYVAGIAEIGIDKFIDKVFATKLKPGKQYVVLNIAKQDIINYLYTCEGKKLCGSDTTVYYFADKAEDGNAFAQYMLMVHGTVCISAKEGIPSQSDRSMLNMINGIVVKRSQGGSTSIQLLLKCMAE